MWLISAECSELIDAIPLLIADEEIDGDVIKTESISDDYADMARYSLKSMLRPDSKPYAVQREEKLIEIERKVLGTASGPPTHNQAVRIHNTQFMADMRMQAQRRAMTRPRWSRER